MTILNLLLLIQQKKINVVVDDINRSIANVDNMYSNMLIKNQKVQQLFIKAEMNNAMSKHLPTFDFEASYSKYDIDNPSSDYNNDNKNNLCLYLDCHFFKVDMLYLKLESLK